jgi:hypothetical protein
MPMPADSPPRAIEVFISYAHEDEPFRVELDKHLRLLQRSGVISNWNDRRIGAGAEWKGQIDAHLASAEIILLLISADFMDSDYCFDVELKRAMERHERGEARVIPVILRPVNWRTASFAKLQAVPVDGRPVTKWGNRDEAFAGIAKRIAEVARELAERPPVVRAAGGLTLNIAIQRRRGNAVWALVPGAEMTYEDEYGIFIETVEETFIYAFQQDSRGSVDVLFPNAQWNHAENPIAAATKLWIPQDTDHWFYLDRTVGREVISIVASRTRNETLEASIRNRTTARLPEWAQSVERGVGGVRRVAVGAPQAALPVMQAEADLIQAAGAEFIYQVEFEHK